MKSWPKRPCRQLKRQIHTEAGADRTILRCKKGQKIHLSNAVTDTRGMSHDDARGIFSFRKGWDKMEKKQAEILAPAGSWASMKAAVAAGADAVYMGGTRFGARAYADNPDEKGLLEAIDYVHLHGRRLYMTVNTLFKESELKELAEYMTPYYNQGLDGVIVQDLGALRIMKENFPGLELHASTQMTITSVYGARMLKDFGCSRVVTSRGNVPG